MASAREGLERGRYWGLVEDGEVQSVASLQVTDHWFGGRRVPCQRIGGVAVPPEHRGRGVASATMRSVLARGLAEGAALSLLYPATVALYRRLGWEHAGLLVRYRLDPRSAPAVGTTLRPVASGAAFAGPPPVLFDFSQASSASSAMARVRSRSSSSSRRMRVTAWRRLV